MRFIRTLLKLFRVDSYDCFSRLRQHGRVCCAKRKAHDPLPPHNNSTAAWKLHISWSVSNLLGGSSNSPNNNCPYRYAVVLSSSHHRLDYFVVDFSLFLRHRSTWPALRCQPRRCEVHPSKTKCSSRERQNFSKVPATAQAPKKKKNPLSFPTHHHDH